METFLHLSPDVTRLFTEDGAILEAADGFQVTRDPALRAILRALTHAPLTSNELIDSLPPDIEPAEAREAVPSLVATGTLLTLPAAITPTAATLWSSLNVEPARAAIAVETYAVEIVGKEHQTRSLRDALGEWGFSASPRPQTLRVVVASDPLEDHVKEENLAALTTGAPWFFVVPIGAEAWVTLFRPGQSACWQCLATRLLHNRPARALAPPIIRSDSSIAQAVAAKLAGAIATFAAYGEIPELENHWTMWLPTHMEQRIVRHPLDQLPHCPACGAPIPDKSPLSNPHHSIPDYRRFISPVTGIARDLRLLSPTGDAFATVIRHRFFDSADSLSGLMQNEQHVAGGKGWSPEEAARSALFEAVERISGCYRQCHAKLEATTTELGSEALLPQNIDLFSDVQRASPSEAGPPTALTIPDDLDPNLQTRWVRAWPLDHDGSPLWFPAGAAFYGYPFEEPRFALATSNGCAAGPTPEAAAIGGLFELIERDAAAIWWYNRIPRPALDLNALDDARLFRMKEAFEEAGRTFDLLDIATDLGVPVVVAVSRRKAGLPGWTLGFGAATSYLEAMLRATGELAQLIPATDDPALRDPAPWVDTATPEENPHLIPDGQVAPSSSTLKPRIEPLSATLHTAGLRAYVIDQTHPLIGVPVVRVLVPGLVHFWRRLGAPRLYDVPVRMGWRSHPMAESGVNSLDLTL